MNHYRYLHPMLLLKFLEARKYIPYAYLILDLLITLFNKKRNHMLFANTVCEMDMRKNAM